MPLYTKHRPESFNTFAGNKKLLTELEGMFQRDRGEIPHSFLFTGPSGCGKTTIARIVAKMLDVHEMDLKEVDSGDFRGIDTVREIRKQMMLRPMAGPCRAWIIDECHQLSKDAQNALLKALEDTPRHVYLLMCTTDPQKLLPTIRNRCSTHVVESLDDERIVGIMKRICRKEGKAIPPHILEQIARDSLGSPRAALVTLDKVFGVPEEEMEAVAAQIASEESQVIDLCRALIGNKPWKDVAAILRGLKDQDAENVRRAVLGYCNSVVLNRGDSRTIDIMICFSDTFFNTGHPGLTVACYTALKSAE